MMASAWFYLAHLSNMEQRLPASSLTRIFHIHTLAPILLIMYMTSQLQNAYSLSCHASMYLPDEGVGMIKAMTNRVPMTG